MCCVSNQESNDLKIITHILLNYISGTDQMFDIYIISFNPKILLSSIFFNQLTTCLMFHP